MKYLTNLIAQSDQLLYDLRYVCTDSPQPACIRTDARGFGKPFHNLRYYTHLPEPLPPPVPQLPGNCQHTRDPPRQREDCFPVTLSVSNPATKRHMNDVKTSVSIPQNCPSAVCDSPLGGGPCAASRRLAEGDLRTRSTPNSATLPRGLPTLPGSCHGSGKAGRPRDGQLKPRARISGTRGA